MARIALFYSPVTSHGRQTTALGAAFAQAGHEVVAHAPEEHLGPALAAGLEARLDPRCAETTVELAVPPGHADAALALRTALAETAVGSFADVSGVLLGDGAELVVADRLAPWASAAACCLGLPLIDSAVTHTLGSTPGGGDPGLTERLADAERFLARLQSVAGRRPDGADSRADRTVLYTCPELTGPLVDDSSVRFVGPLRGGPRDDEPRPTARPLVHVSPELAAPDRPGLLETIVAALGELESELDAVVTTADGLHSAALGPLPGNVSFAHPAASPETLARTSLSLADAGIDSVLDAMLAGIPMVCVPATRDQLAGAQRVTELRAGRLVGTEDVVAVRATVSAVLADAAARVRASELGDALRAIDGPARVAELATGLLGARAG